MEPLVVLAGAIPADRDPGRYFRHAGLVGQIDHHPPEEPHELVAPLQRELPAAVVDDVHLEPGEALVGRPLLRLADEV
jgi:hypothetical protein